MKQFFFWLCGVGVGRKEKIRYFLYNILREIIIIIIKSWLLKCPYLFDNQSCETAKCSPVCKVLALQLVSDESLHQSSLF